VAPNACVILMINTVLNCFGCHVLVVSVLVRHCNGLSVQTQLSWCWSFRPYKQVFSRLRCTIFGELVSSLI